MFLFSSATFVSLLAVLAVVGATTEPDSVSKWCSRTDVPCLGIPKCHKGGKPARIEKFYVTTTPPGTKQPATYPTRVELCWDDSGLRIHGNATDRNIWSTSSKCDDADFAQATALRRQLTPFQRLFACYTCPIAPQMSLCESG